MSSSFLYFVYRFLAECRVFLFFHSDLVEVTVPFSDIFLSALLGFFVCYFLVSLQERTKKEKRPFRSSKNSHFQNATFKVQNFSCENEFYLHQNKKSLTYQWLCT